MINADYGVSGVLLALSGICSRWRADGAPDDCLDGDLLLCLAGGECGVSNRQRDVPLEVRALAIALFYSIGTGIAASSGALSVS